MAKQCGTFLIRGTIDDLSFYKTKHGFLVRTKTGLPWSVIKKDPRFAGTRNASSEFGRAGAGSKVLRQALRCMLGIRTGKTLNNRLTSSLLNVIQADPVHKKGKREVLSGDLNALRGFEFKPESPLSGVLVAPYYTDINRAAGLVSFEIPALDASMGIVFPSGATHARLVVAAVNLCSKPGSDGFEAKADVRYSDFLVADGLASKPLTVCCAGIDAENPLVVVVGVEFWQDVHGEMVSLAGGWCSSAAVVAVDFKIPGFHAPKLSTSSIQGRDFDDGVWLAESLCVRCWMEDGLEKTETIRLSCRSEADLCMDSQVMAL